MALTFGPLMIPGDWSTCSPGIIISLHLNSSDDVEEKLVDLLHHVHPGSGPGSRERRERRRLHLGVALAVSLKREESKPFPGRAWKVRVHSSTVEQGAFNSLVGSSNLPGPITTKGM